jgi:hypothetical protein
MGVSIVLVLVLSERSERSSSSTVEFRFQMSGGRKTLILYRISRRADPDTNRPRPQ